MRNEFKTILKVSFLIVCLTVGILLTPLVYQICKDTGAVITLKDLSGIYLGTPATFIFFGLIILKLTKNEL